MAWIKIEIGEGPNPWGRDAKYDDRTDDISWEDAFELYGEFQQRLIDYEKKLIKKND